MKKILVIIALILVVLASIGAGVIISFSSSDHIALKSEVFFVKTNTTHTFDMVFTGDLSAEFLSQIVCDNDDVVLVNENGFFARSIGSANIVVEKLNLAFKICVLDSPMFMTNDSIFENPSTISGFVGDEIVVVENACADYAYYADENPAFIFNAETGKITLIEVGTSTLRLVFQISNNTFTEMEITVECSSSVFATSFFPTETLTLKLGGQPFVLSSVISPDSLNRNIVFSSENALVASVDTNGSVTPVGLGETHISTKIETSSGVWNETFTQVFVYPQVSASILHIYDENGLEKTSIDNASREETNQGTFSIVASFSSLPSNASFSLVCSSELTELSEQIIDFELCTVTFFVSISFTTDFSIFCRTSQNWNNSELSTLDSSVTTVSVSYAAEKFSFVPTGYAFSGGTYPLVVENENYLLFLQPDSIDELSVSKTSFEIVKNFSREVNIEIYEGTAIAIENGFIVAKELGLGSITINAQDPVNELEEQIVTFEVKPLFESELNTSKIQICAYNDIPFEPYDYALPQLNSLLSFGSNLNMQSQEHAFSVTNNQLLATTVSNDYLCIYLFDELISRISVEIERKYMDLVITYQGETSVVLSETNNLIIVDTYTEILLIVSTQTTISEEHNYNLLILDSQGLPSSYSVQGLSFYGASPMTQNTISLFATTARNFIIRVFVEEHEEMYFDILVTVQ